jgi:hypothetical protein
MGDEAKIVYNFPSRNNVKVADSEYKEIIQNLDDPRLYLNKELNWLKLLKGFLKRVEILIILF